MMEAGFYNMDCMDAMCEFEDGFFDLAIVDPPYGIDKAFSPTSRVTRYGQTKTVNDAKPGKAYFDELFRVSKDQIIWGYNHLSDMLPTTKEFIFWFKHQPVTSYSDGELAWTSFTRTAKCFDYPFFGAVGSETDRIHPTQKPVALYKWILQKYARGGAKILDTHAGSASSLIACYQMGFAYWGFEIDEEYYHKASERLERERCQVNLLTLEPDKSEQTTLPIESESL